MTLLDGLGVAASGRVLGALVLSLGPGYVLLSLYPDNRKLGIVEVLALSTGLSLAFWPTFLSWLQCLGIALSSWFVFGLAALTWVAGLARRQPWKLPRTFRDQGTLGHLALCSVFIFAAITRLYALRETPVGPGSDSYHHSLIAHMIVERGMLPDSYHPFAPLATFTYHFGFHSLIAVVSWLSGVGTVTLVPLVGQLLNAAAALSAAYLTFVTTRSLWSATISAALAGLVSVFPAYLVNWGRFTQLAGLTLLPVFLGVVWHWLESGHPRQLIPYVSLLAAGIALTHYRIALMAAMAATVFLGAIAITQRLDQEAWVSLGQRALLSLAVAGGLVAPWVAHLIQASAEGFPIGVGLPGATFFSLRRLGPGVGSFPTNSIVLAVTLFSALLALWQRPRAVCAQLMWGVTVLGLSISSLAGVYLDTISTVISLYLPASVLIGWAVVWTSDWLAGCWKPAQWLLTLGLLTLTVQGSAAIGSIIEPEAPYVGADDLPALEWIRLNTPESSHFMVNTYNWDFLPDYVIGSDAGYWLPLLAARRSATLPMTYPHERSDVPGLNERLVALHRLGGHLTSTRATALLRQEGITHVYIGQRGGPIIVDELIESPAFHLSYRNGSAYVFRFE